MRDGAYFGRTGAMLGGTRRTEAVTASVILDSAYGTAMTDAMLMLRGAQAAKSLATTVVSSSCTVVAIF
jgi:hypothetical protein